MSQPQEPESEAKPKLITPVAIVTDLAASAVFFLVFWLFILPPHVPAFTPVPVYFWSAYTAFCLTGVFWIGLQLFRVTLARQRLDRVQSRA